MPKVTSNKTDPESESRNLTSDPELSVTVLYYLIGTFGALPLLIRE